ncbi:DUF3467 domain-containing protein [Stieleria sp. JC731]|uniref:DUF3467 domain-containing protein n=1 Tax=Pirellulaceae TaxID=2691357 RepID=UPI001E5BE96D|nr:DUF3467 domain-containing protein [Stieleria sp. JC731]MCC9603057.1 DUF3467 domain-containing protein [Stieleria sp. JC731]
MSDDHAAGSGPQEPGNNQNPPLRARVPEHVARGMFSTGAIVMTGPSEYIVDFLQTIGRPHVVAARVVIPHSVMPQFIEALQTNLDLYTNRFGAPGVPKQQQPNPDARRPTPQEIYDDLKLPDEVLSGTYANGVMIGHGATEFGLDFLTSFFPQSAVSSRVFVAAGQVPRLLDSLKGAVRQLELRRNEAASGQSPNPAVETSPDSESDDSTSGPNDPPPAAPGDDSIDPPPAS